MGGPSDLQSGGVGSGGLSLAPYVSPLWKHTCPLKDLAPRIRQVPPSCPCPSLCMGDRLDIAGEGRQGGPWRIRPQGVTLYPGNFAWCFKIQLPRLSSFKSGQGII